MDYHDRNVFNHEKSCFSMSSLQDLDAQLKKARKKYPWAKRRAYASSLAGLLSLSFAAGMDLTESPYFRFTENGFVGWGLSFVPVIYSRSQHKKKRELEREQRELPRSIRDRAEYLLKETRDGHRGLTRRNEITYGILNGHIDQEEYHLTYMESENKRKAIQENDERAYDEMGGDDEFFDGFDGWINPQT